jgi:hypothetical protein
MEEIGKKHPFDGPKAQLHVMQRPDIRAELVTNTDTLLRRRTAVKDHTRCSLGFVLLLHESE